MFSQSPRMSPELRRLLGGTRKVGSVLQKTDKAEDQPWVGSKQSPSKATGPVQGQKTPSPAATPIRECQGGGVGRAAEGCSWGLGGKGSKWSCFHLSSCHSPRNVDGFSSRDGGLGFWGLRRKMFFRLLFFILLLFSDCQFSSVWARSHPWTLAPLTV